jgi:hypothetical protein
MARQWIFRFACGEKICRAFLESDGSITNAGAEWFHSAAIKPCEYWISCDNCAIVHVVNEMTAGGFQKGQCKLTNAANPTNEVMSW